MIDALVLLAQCAATSARRLFVPALILGVTVWAAGAVYYVALLVDDHVSTGRWGR